MKELECLQALGCKHSVELGNNIGVEVFVSVYLPFFFNLSHSYILLLKAVFLLLAHKQKLTPDALPLQFYFLQNKTEILSVYKRDLQEYTLNSAKRVSRDCRSMSSRESPL